MKCFGEPTDNDRDVSMELDCFIVADVSRRSGVNRDAQIEKRRASRDVICSLVKMQRKPGRKTKAENRKKGEPMMTKRDEEFFLNTCTGEHR